MTEILFTIGTPKCGTLIEIKDPLDSKGRNIAVIEYERPDIGEISKALLPIPEGQQLFVDQTVSFTPITRHNLNGNGGSTTTHTLTVK